MLHIYGTKAARKIIYLLSFICIVFSQQVDAQLFKNDSGSSMDEKDYFFGITLGTTRTGFGARMHPRFLQDDSVYVAEPGFSSGFQLGLSATARISEHFQVRFNPQLMFFDRPIRYSLKYPDYTTGALEATKKVESVNLSFPIQGKFLSDRIGNFRFYALGGVKADIDLASNADARKAEDLVKIKPNDFGLELGLGGSFYFKSFTLSPELKFSNGLNNLHSRDNNLIYSSVFDKIYSRMIVFCIHIEG